MPGLVQGLIHALDFIDQLWTLVLGEAVAHVEDHLFFSCIMSAIARRSSGRAPQAPGLAARMHELDALARPDPVAVDRPLAGDGQGNRKPGERHDALEEFNLGSGREGASTSGRRRSVQHDAMEAAAGPPGWEGVLHSVKPFLSRLAAVCALERRS